ncbi:MAG: DEAD/DEAH box helicase [Deltaproteobacteria bacterium]|nr:DEAD/DEAH box helicase [Deltaproteobacteria bacterium]
MASPILDVVRKACLPAIWSQGVKLAREKSVSRVRSSAGTEASFRVRAPGHAVAPTVVLYLEDEEWSCDCGGKVDPCAHVAAAVIADAAGEASEAPAATDGGAEGDATPARTRLQYRFGRRERRLGLERVVIFPDGKEEKLGATLGSGLAKGRTPKGLEPTHDDVKIDVILGNPARPIVPLGRIGDVFASLSEADVTFEGKPIAVSGEPLRPIGVVEEANGGFVLRIEKDPSIDEVVVLGVARCGNTLRPLGETETTGEWLEKLPLSRTFGRAQETELVTKVLPEIEKKLVVDVRTKRLPGRKADVRPRIAMDLSHHGHALSVLPTLVYGDPPMARIDGDDVVALGKHVPVRRREEERSLVQRLREELDLVPGRRVDFDGAEATRFAKRLRGWYERRGDARSGAVFEGEPLAPRLLTGADGTFDVVFEHPGDGEGGEAKRADTAAVMHAWREGLDLVPLEGGGWAPLPAGWLAQHGHRVADLLAARDAAKKVASAALPDLAALCDALDAPRPLAVDKLAPLLEGFERIPHAALPNDVAATLRTYQQTGVDWLSFLRDAELGGVLADDMGLGKTLQTICALRGRVLVVCPKSVVYNWQAEIARFRPGLRASIYHGPERTLDPKADVTLTTYAVLRLDVEKLAAQEWDVVVLDEAQAIKNESSQTARAAFQLRARFRIALSGTPVENRLEELWSVMHFTNPGLLGGRSDFADRYASPIASGDASAAGRLRAKIRPFVLRRMKRDVLPELPPRTDAVLHVALDDDERAVYDAVRAATKKDLLSRLSGPEGAKGPSVLAALEALLRLRQAACHSALVPGQRRDGSSKVERLLEALEEAAQDGHKALVFSQWTSLLDLVEPHLEAASIRFTRLDGSTRDRAAVVAELQDPNGPPVMLVSLKAGGTGLNLTAADHVFLLDPWWNPAVEDQAADRAHRIGQDRPVMVYRMIAKDTVEERIFALQEKKRALADVALGNADHAGGITREELLALLD